VNRPASLGLIRLALLAGVLLLGAVSWYTHRQAGWTSAPLETLRLLSTAVRAIWVAAFVGLVIVFVVAQRRPVAAQTGRYEIIGWALGEAPALAGGIYYLLGGDPRRYMWGVAGLLLTFVIFPGRPRESA
jgi:hypothetical protein